MKEAKGKLNQYAYADFYVATNGNDAWSGKLSEPNADGTDGPFATIERARDALRLASFNEYRSMYVLIRGGEYHLNKTVVFDGRDTHYESYEKVFANYPGETPVFDSDITITGWRLAQNVPGLPASSAGKVYEADMPELPDGKKRFYTLYDDGKMLTRARSAGQIPCERFSGGDGYMSSTAVINMDRKTLHYRNPDFRNWDNPEDIEVFVMPGVGYVTNYLPLTGVDEENHLLKTAIPAAYPMGIVHTGVKPINGGTFCVENAIDFLTEPGNWVVDTKRKKVYYYPLNGKPGHVTCPALTEYIRIDGHERGEIVKGITLEGLGFTRSDRAVVTDDDLTLQHEWDVWNKNNAMIRMRDAEDCAVRNCRIFNGGTDGIRLDLHCQSNVVEGNLIEYVGGTGILLCGYGPGRVNVNRCNKILNNHIHHISRFYYQSSAIIIWQSSENTIAHNLIHNVPYVAIVLSGVRISYFNAEGHIREMAETIRCSEVAPDARHWDVKDIQDLHDQGQRTVSYMMTRNNVLEDNEIFQAVETMHDGNGIYLSDVGCGNIIRRNYIHHLCGKGMQQAIRTDAAVKHALIRDNVIYNCVGGGINTKHVYNHAINNIIADIRNIVTTDFEGNPKKMYVGYFGLLEVKREMMPKNGCLRVERNILYKTNPDQTFYREKFRDGKHVEGNLEDTDIDCNLYYDVNAADHGAAKLKYYQSRGADLHGAVGDPMFVDIKHGDFRLKDDSPAFALGFEEIPFQNIGLTTDYPQVYEQIVRQELGDDYASFERLEKLCNGECPEDKDLQMELRF